jgi:hypothetical protein
MSIGSHQLGHNQMDFPFDTSESPYREVVEKEADIGRIKA